MKQTIITKNPEETVKFAENFAKKMKGGEVILLFGNLGAGKTTFMQGFAKGLGITQRIISPTFIILRQYKGETIDLFHADLYRLTHEKEIEELGLLDVIKDKRSVVAIEWPEKIGSLIPEQAIFLRFNGLSENEREITIENTYE